MIPENELAQEHFGNFSSIPKDMPAMFEDY